MKYLLLTLGAGLLFSSCAGVRVTDTQTAAVVTARPKAIYIEPFTVEGAQFVGHHRGGPGERPIDQSLAPAEFGEALKEELEKLAPTRVLLPDEAATLGWLVEGSIDIVDAGNPAARAAGLPQLNPLGRSHIAIHVRVIDLSGPTVLVESKSAGTLHRHGKVIYEFDVAGGSRLSGPRGTLRAPGLGYSAPFDYRNAAERIRYALEPDPHRYGLPADDADPVGGRHARLSPKGDLQPGALVSTGEPGGRSPFVLGGGLHRKGGSRGGIGDMRAAWALAGTAASRKRGWARNRVRAFGNTCYRVAHHPHDQAHFFVR